MLVKWATDVLTSLGGGGGGGGGGGDFSKQSDDLYHVPNMYSNNN